MKKAPIPKDEKIRLCALEGLKLLDTETEERFDKITQKAIAMFNVPISTITLVDKDREWFKSYQGLSEREGSRDMSFCGHALLAEDVFIVEDTLADDRFSDNPMVTSDPYIRFYAGKTLYEHESQQPVGVFCIKDHKPRKMSLEEIASFLELAEEAEKEINK